MSYVKGAGIPSCLNRTHNHKYVKVNPRGDICGYVIRITNHNYGVVDKAVPLRGGYYHLLRESSN